MQLKRKAKLPTVIGLTTCIATETSLKIEMPLVVSLDMMLSTKRMTKALIKMCECAGASAPLLFANPEDRFSESRPICSHVTIHNDIAVWPDYNSFTNI